MNRGRRAFAALALALSLTLSGCASDSGETPIESSPPSAAASQPAGGSMPAVVPTAAPAPITAEEAADGQPYEYLGVTVSGGPRRPPTVDLAADFAPVNELAIADVWVGKGDPVEPGATAHGPVRRRRAEVPRGVRLLLAPG